MKKLKRIFCAVFRHSNIETFFFGYHYCARCEAQLGDSLAGAYRNPDSVFVRCKDMQINHRCTHCQTNWNKAGFFDKFLAQKPEWLKTPNLES